MRTLPSRRNPRNKAATNRRTPRRLTSPKETKSSRHWSAESPNDIFHSLGRQDEGHFWSVSRYIHLNPVRGKRPLVSHPRDWLWSSYPGYGDKRKRLPWVSYDLVLAAWQSGSGGSNPAAAYRRYVEQGLERPPKNPLAGAAHGWLLGGKDFVDRIRRGQQSHPPCRPGHGKELTTAKRPAYT